MSRGATAIENRRRCWLEGAFTGIGYATALAALSVFLVGSFRPRDLPMPYWGDLRGLRTDTFGAGCFIVASVSICFSEYFRLSRVAQSPKEAGAAVAADPTRLFALAAARTLVAAGTVLVGYISLNSITHPETLLIQATHFFTWPTEGTLRVVGLVLVALAATFARTLRIDPAWSKHRMMVGSDGAKVTKH